MLTDKTVERSIKIKSPKTVTTVKKMRGVSPFFIFSVLNGYFSVFYVRVEYLGFAHV